MCSLHLTHTLVCACTGGAQHLPCPTYLEQGHTSAATIQRAVHCHCRQLQRGVSAQPAYTHAHIQTYACTYVHMYIHTHTTPPQTQTALSYICCIRVGMLCTTVHLTSDSEYAARHYKWWQCSADLRLLKMIGRYKSHTTCIQKLTCNIIRQRFSKSLTVFTFVSAGTSLCSVIKDCTSSMLPPVTAAWRRFCPY